MNRPEPFSPRQRGLTLIELLLALALTALLGLMLATLIDGWVGVRTHAAATGRDGEVLELCQRLEHRLAALVERPLRARGLALYNDRLNWQPDRHRLEWVALSGPGLAGPERPDDGVVGPPGRFGESPGLQVAGYQFSALQRQALQWREDELWFGISADLDTPAAPRWQTLALLTPVTDVRLLFRVDEQWQPYPGQAGRQTEAIRLQFGLPTAPDSDPVPYVCTFVLPEG